MEERTLVDAHGVEVFTRWWPLDDPRAVVLVSHGASEHSARYGRFAEQLNASGVAAVALDHRGHGRTAPSTGRGIMGPGGGEAVLDDLQEVAEIARRRFGDTTPQFLFGHSLGAAIGLAHLTRHAADLAGAVICGFPVDLAEADALGPALQGFADAGMRDEPAGDLLRGYNAPFEPGRTPFDWLSRDSEEVDRYIADPMCGDGNPLTYGFLIDLFGVVAPAARALGAISCPVLVIAGDHDPAAGMGAHARALGKALADAGVAVDTRIYEGARHELLNEINRDEVTGDVVAWLLARIEDPVTRERR